MLNYQRVSLMDMDGGTYELLYPGGPIHRYIEVYNWAYHGIFGG